MNVLNELEHMIEESMFYTNIGKFVSMNINNSSVVCGFLSDEQDFLKLFGINKLLILDDIPLNNELGVYLYYCVYKPIEYKNRGMDLYTSCSNLTIDNIIHLPCTIKVEIELIAQEIIPFSAEQFAKYMIDKHFRLSKILVDYYLRTYDAEPILHLLTNIDLNQDCPVVEYVLDKKVGKQFILDFFSYHTQNELSIFKTEYCFYIIDGYKVLNVLPTEIDSFIQLKNNIKEK